ncbi:GGDEF domain-containing protein [Inhella crocodyli]|uniref:diguanylate cyclase n=1 Tax=Inhella crocodyli TaxID=2499851 RepID=A0A437LLY4_9BURK|nr:GGDEF domain-containing protein [Inhella crocodyli]RVT86278.1 GGDEF domain-containing protein [Inhella crocodyli]
MPTQDTLFPITEAQRTAYARQLRQGFGRLRFEPDLEAAFMADFDRGLDRRLAWLSLLITVVWLVFTALDPVRMQPDRLPPAQLGLWTELLLVRGVVAAVLLGATWRAWRHPLGAHRRRWVVATALVVTVGGAWGATCYLRLGGFQPLEILLLLVAGLFLPIGLTLRQTLPLAAVCLTGMSAVGVLQLEGAAQGRFLYLAGLMVLTALLAAFGAYHREYAQREQFLLRAELGWQAGHDALTGLCNRRLFDDRLQALVRQVQRDGLPLALVLADVDHFKRFNDVYGHPAGDAALQTVAEVLQAMASRPLDLVARLGGEEMAVVLHGASQADAMRLATQALAALRERGVPHAGSEQGWLGMSLGLAMAEPGDTPLALYQRADRALYQAKHSGRNRVIAAA